LRSNPMLVMMSPIQGAINYGREDKQIASALGLITAFPHVHSNNTRPPASVRISVIRANFPYCLQCRSASSCTSLAWVANHLRTRALGLPFAGGGSAMHEETASAIPMMMTGLKSTIASARGFVGKTLSGVKSKAAQDRDSVKLPQALGCRPSVDKAGSPRGRAFHCPEL
jgi:hypothetical protein